MIEKYHAYVFIGGMCIGSFSNVFSNIVISGLLLYIVTPEIFTTSRWESLKTYTWKWFVSKKDTEIKDETEMINGTDNFFGGSLLTDFNYPKIEIL